MRVARSGDLADMGRSSAAPLPEKPKRAGQAPPLQRNALSGLSGGAGMAAFVTAFVAVLVVRFAGRLVIGMLLRWFGGVVVGGLRGAWVRRSCGWRTIRVGGVG